MEYLPLFLNDFIFLGPAHFPTSRLIAGLVDMTAGENRVFVLIPQTGLQHLQNDRFCDFLPSLASLSIRYGAKVVVGFRLFSDTFTTNLRT